MGGNTFYTNAEAYAYEILQQKLIKEAQRSAQQTMMELSAFRTLFGQGQFVYCIPFGGVGYPSLPMPFPFFGPPALPPPEPCTVNTPESHPLPSSSSGSSAPASTPPSSSCSSQPQQSVIHLNVKNARGKIVSNKPGSDECNLGKDGIEVTIDLRDYLPAEICLNAEEQVVEIKANHVNSQGSKTFARRYDLPACIILDSVKCILTHDGYLMFSAAWCKME